MSIIISTAIICVIGSFFIPKNNDKLVFIIVCMWVAFLAIIGNITFDNKAEYTEAFLNRDGNQTIVTISNCTSKGPLRYCQPTKTFTVDSDKLIQTLLTLDTRR